METNTPDTSERVVKVPFPIALIRRMDEALLVEVGGFRTRAEFMQEAVENMLNELQFTDAPDEPTARPSAMDARDIEIRALADGRFSGLPEWEVEELTLADLAGTTIHPPAAAPALVVAGVGSTQSGPMLGLHNRDYVSIWALNRLALYTENGLLPFDEFLRHATKAAWFFGSQVSALETDATHAKLAVLLPTNVSKQPSAERGFQTFAIGAATALRDGKRTTSGPLFAWGTIQIDREGLTGLTRSGFELLTAMDGLSLRLPHLEHLAHRFFEHLQRHSPDDWSGFQTLIAIAAESPTRDILVERFRLNNSEWSDSTASSVAQGYVARGREWGLLHPKLASGRYSLTRFGDSLALADQSRLTHPASPSDEGSQNAN
jgi:hypothetical protein